MSELHWRLAGTAEQKAGWTACGAPMFGADWTQYHAGVTCDACKATELWKAAQVERVLAQGPCGECGGTGIVPSGIRGTRRCAACAVVRR